MKPLGGRGASRDWRAAVAAFDRKAAEAPVTLHTAQMLLARNMNAEAAAALSEFLDAHPEHQKALITLGTLLRRLGRRQEAAEVFARAARVEVAQMALADGERGAVEQYLSAADQCGSSPDKAPDAYVAAIFDKFADRFESHLREQLAYRAPELLFDAVTRVAGRQLRELDVLDLGCGTGLAGELFRPLARRLAGVDLSPKMLAKAKEKRVYDRLVESDLVTCLSEAAECWDLIVAADVLVYLGELRPVLAAARLALRPGGWLAFTVEAGEGADYHLQPVRRYAHGREYLMQAAESSGLIIRCLEEAVTRTESTNPVRSFVCVLASAPETKPTAGLGEAKP